MQQKLGTTSVAFDIGITGTAAERRAKLSTLGSWLNVTESKNLVLPDTPTWFYKAVPDGQVTTERGINGEIAHVAFTAAPTKAPIAQRIKIGPSPLGSFNFNGLSEQ